MIERRLPIENAMIIQGKECAFGDINQYETGGETFNMTIKMTKGTLKTGTCESTHILIPFDVTTDGIGTTSS
jgi:hypothetical protein